MAKEREFVFTDKDFRLIQNLVGRHTGISLSDAKRDLVYSRLARRLRALGMVHFKDYIHVLDDENEDELIQFTNAITTNLTSFFRENHHFEHLAKTALPEIMKRNAQSRRIRIWSAGCSTGEEPYSLAMTIRETVPATQGWDVKILATDLDSNVLERAQNGLYAEERVNGISKSRLRKYFMKGRGENSENVRVSPSLQELITFKQLNLMHEWPIKGPFDIIFCRNVVIYFDKPTQKILFERYANILHPEGYLYVGHSESLYRVTKKFELIGNTIYKQN